MTDGIDFTYLKTVSGGDEAFELNMIETLIAEIDEKMKEMQVNILASNAEGMRLHAHSLKNLYGVLGIDLLRQNFLQLESGCKQMSQPILDHQFLQCEKEWNLKKEALDNVIASYKVRLS